MWCSSTSVNWCYVIWCFTLITCLVEECRAIAVAEVRLLSDSNHKEYVLQNEGATLTCHYILENSEKVTEVEWHKDGELVYLWAVDEKPKAYGVLQGHADTAVKSPSTLSIQKAQMGMQGTYSCHVRTNGKTASNEAYVMVIVDACYDDAWKTHTDMITCTETINMHCVGMSPKPSPACGVYSESTGKFLSSIPFDSITMLWNGTYEVSFNRRFHIKDWINHTDISFNCYMVVMGTTWRSGVKHRMFGDNGCVEDPPQVAHSSYNMSTERSCWGYPKEGSTVEYQCEDEYKMVGSGVLACSHGLWTSVDSVFDGDDDMFPVCVGGSHNLKQNIIFQLTWTIIITTILSWTL